MHDMVYTFELIVVENSSFQFTWVQSCVEARCFGMGAM